MGLAVFGVLWSELGEAPVLPALVQVVATLLSWPLVHRLGTTHSDVPSCGRSQASTAARSAAATTRTAWFLPGRKR